MYTSTRYVQLANVAVITHDDASVDIIPNPEQGLYLYVEKAIISVYEAAIGGGGILELLDTDGDPFYRLNVDGVKDLLLDFGAEGVKVGSVINLGLQAMLSGADTQASVSLAITAHLDVD